jgi:hypothetical protein
MFALFILDLMAECADIGGTSIVETSEEDKMEAS